jgi:hypothetical protein
MMADAAPRAGRSLVRRVAGRLLLALVLVAPLVLLLLAVETAPRVADRGPPDAGAAAQARDVASRLRALLEADHAPETWSVGEAEIDAVFAAAGRMTPGVLADAEVGEAALVVRASIGAPHLPGGLWANLELALAPSEEELRVASAKIGRLPLPPALAVAGLRMALDRAFGEGLGGETIESVAGLRLAPPVVTVALRRDDGQGAAMLEGLKDRLLRALGTTARERVHGQLWAMQKGVARRRLPRDGSMVPYVRQVVRFAARPSPGADREEARAALYALALYCGDPGFAQTIAVTLPEQMDGARNGCTRTTLEGRDDLKRHFVISAGLYAATTGRAAFGMGELKELLDSNDGGSGFSFEDMAADAAGLKFAERLLATPRARWPELIERIGSDADLMPSLEGLPHGLGAAEFRARYGDVDSPEYAALVAEIQRRVDALPLYSELIAN